MATNAQIKVTLTRSNAQANKFQVHHLRGLGLKKINDVSVLPDTPAVRGMISKVSHLVAVEQV